MIRVMKLAPLVEVQVIVALVMEVEKLIKI